VPLLLLWLDYDERVATGTSLAAIAVIAIWAGGVHGALGNVDITKGLLMGIPAVGGVVAGTWLQQRVPVRAIAGLFALVMFASAVALIL
jgi:uncharacterized membrane protein YfcA